MSMDQALKNRDTLRKANGVVDGQKVSVAFDLDYGRSPPYWIRIEAKAYSPKCFFTKFFANKYFNNLLKEYNLIEKPCKPE